jgi:hypothetical protein
MRLAGRALRDGYTTIAVLAAQRGHASESSSSHAFQRITASTPGRYHRTVGVPVSARTSRRPKAGEQTDMRHVGRWPAQDPKRITAGQKPALRRDGIDL